MGPFPHDAPPAKISGQNPAGTDGFEFVEFAHPRPDELAKLFERMGYTPVARHKTKNSRSIVRATSLHSSMPSRAHSRPVSLPTTVLRSFDAWRVVDAKHAFEHAVKLGAEPYAGSDKTLAVPAIKGIGGSLLYFVDATAPRSPYDVEFSWIGERDPKPKGVGFHYLDHLTTT